MCLLWLTFGVLKRETEHNVMSSLLEAHVLLLFFSQAECLTCPQRVLSRGWILTPQGKTLVGRLRGWGRTPLGLKTVCIGGNGGDCDPVPRARGQAPPPESCLLSASSRDSLSPA